MNDTPIFTQFTLDFVEQVLKLANHIHGAGYMSREELVSYVHKSQDKNENASYVALLGEQVIGFRITLLPETWKIDQWCTPEKWQIDKQHLAYFKCNTISEEYQGQGIGRQLLDLSLETLKKLGVKGGLSHIWMESPGNASFKYFTKAGGQTVKLHKNRWLEESKIANYICVRCNGPCHCSANEMILYF